MRREKGVGKVVLSTGEGGEGEEGSVQMQSELRLYLHHPLHHCAYPGQKPLW